MNSNIVGTEQRTAYAGKRSVIIKMIQNNPVNVLDVGCSNGVLLSQVKQRYDIRFAARIEWNPLLAEEARGKVDLVLNTDLKNFRATDLSKISFDLIILADVLEHLANPENVLKEILKPASSEAFIIISLPNIQHRTVIKNLLIGEWPQREKGLYDKTHLRFFTLKTIRKLVNQCDLRIDRINRNLRSVDSPWPRVNILSRLFSLRPLLPYFTYKYIISCRFLGKIHSA